MEMKDCIFPAPNFISHERFKYWFDTGLPVYHCEFNKDLYSDRLFDNFGIGFPETLRNSVTKRRAEFLAGRYCASRTLQRMGIADAEVGIGKHRNPMWPRNTIGSISHCGSGAVAISGHKASLLGVGIDIQERVDGETAEMLRTQVVNTDEISLVFYRCPDEIPLLFTLAFSVKESFFKAAYPMVGHYFNFDAVSLVAIDLRARTILLRINQALHEKLADGMLVNGLFHILPDGKVVTLIVLHPWSFHGRSQQPGLPAPLQRQENGKYANCTDHESYF